MSPRPRPAAPRLRRSVALAAGPTILGALLLLAPPARGQAPAPPSAEEITVVGDARYAEAGRLHRLLFGDDYRDLWARPFRATGESPSLRSPYNAAVRRPKANRSVTEPTQRPP